MEKQTKPPPLPLTLLFCQCTLCCFVNHWLGAHRRPGRQFKSFCLLGLDNKAKAVNNFWRWLRMRMSSQQPGDANKGLLQCYKSCDVIIIIHIVFFTDLPSIKLAFAPQMWVTIWHWWLPRTVSLPPRQHPELRTAGALRIWLACGNSNNLFSVVQEVQKGFKREQLKSITNLHQPMIRFWLH